MLAIKSKLQKIFELTDEDAIHKYLRILKILGLYLNYDDLGIPIRKPFNRLYPLYCVIVISFCMVTFFCGQWIDAHYVIQALDLENFTQTCCVALNFTGLFLKFCNLISQRQKFSDMLELNREMCRKYVIDEKKSKIMQTHERSARLLFSFFLYVTIFTNFLCFVGLVIEPDKAIRSFPYRVYQPPGIPKFILYPLICGIVFWNAMGLVSYDAIVVCMLFKVVTQVQVLNENIKAIPNGNTNEDKIVKLRECIIQHQLILRLRNYIEELFSLVFLMQFTVSMLLSGLSGFQTTVSGFSRSQFNVLFYCFCIIIELSLICFTGHLVIDESDKLATCAYTTPWYNYGQKFCYMLIMYMRKLQQSLVFTASGFFLVSLPTFTGVLVRSYSYIALLRQMYYGDSE